MRYRAFRRRALSRSSAFLCHRQSPIQFTHSTIQFTHSTIQFTHSTIQFTHSKRASGTFTRVHVCHPCVTRFQGQRRKFSTRTSQLRRKKMLFCFFVVKLVGLFPLRVEHVDRVLSSCKLAATSSVAVTKAFVPSAFSAKETQAR